MQKDGLRLRRIIARKGEPMRAHCLFEQSGTFKNEFKKLGYQSFDYDIQNNFNQTDFVVDIFAEIEKAWGGGEVCLTQ